MVPSLDALTLITPLIWVYLLLYQLL